MWWFTGCQLDYRFCGLLLAVRIALQLGKRENVPVLGWLWLRGRCHCKTKISVRYPVEAATGLLFCWCSGRLKCLLKHLVIGRLATGAVADRFRYHDLPNPLTHRD